MTAKLAISHEWDLSVAEAREVQDRLAAQVVKKTTFDLARLNTVAGVDVSVQGQMARAAVVVLSFPELRPVDWACGQAPLAFPYVPGLLTFREGPSVLAALESLGTWPDLFIFDGHGVAHPRRVGLAAHMGVILDQPSIGCAKSRLTGSHGEVGEARGEWAALCDGEQVIGAVLRTRSGIRPVFVSIGHRVDLQTAIEVVLRCSRGYRLPETTRYAHNLAGGAKLELDPGDRDVWIENGKMRAIVEGGAPR